MKTVNVHGALLALACTVVGGQTQAQSAPETSGTEARGLEEILVSAQRRRENVQDVPIAVSVVTEEAMEQLGITDPQSAPLMVPGLTFQRQVSGSTPFIRGIGTTAGFIGNEPSVAMYVDDTYIPSGNAAVFEFNNIELIEALKGPQGTLFGRNATGGVIHVHTRNPSHAPTADISLGYGNYDALSGQLYVSGGIQDAVSGSISAFVVDQGKGWGRNVVTGEEVSTRESWGVRSKLLIEPGESLSILVSGTYNSLETDIGTPTRVVPGFFGFAGYDPAALGAGFYDSATSRAQITDTTFHQFSGKVTKELKSATLVSISAYSKTDTFFRIDLDTAPADIITADVNNWGKTFTQELQLLSPSGSAVNWILGAFFLHDESSFDMGVFGDAIPIPGFRMFEQAKQKTTSLSGFSQASMEILPETNLTIGLRFTRDEREESEGGSSIATPDKSLVVMSSGPFGSETSYSSLTGRFAVDHRFTDELMGYLAFNRGFKSGVYNLPGYSVSTIAALPAVLPEELNAYSIGFKSELMDRRIRLNGEAYYYDYKNIQVQTVVPPPNTGTILTNGGAASIKGFELELTAMPMDRLTLSASLAYVDGEYNEFDAGPMFFPQPPNAPIAIPSGCAFSTYPIGEAGSPASQQTCSLAGNETVNTPPFSSTLSLLYTRPTRTGDLDFAVSWAHGGDFYSEPGNLSVFKQPKTDLVNSSIKWTSPDEHYDVLLWGRNLLDEESYTFLDISAISGPRYHADSPRTYGITVSVRF